MFKRQPKRRVAPYVELPTGIFTADAVWFHTTEKDLRAFAGELLERFDLESIFSDAAVWIRSAQAVAGLVLIASLPFVSAPVAMLLTLSVFVFWYAAVPEMVFPSLTSTFRLLSSALLQGVLFILVLSWLGGEGRTGSVAAGLAGFILLRWGLVDKAMHHISKIVSHRAIPREDLVLRNLIIRKAIGLKITLPATDSFEQRILEIWNLRNRR